MNWQALMLCDQQVSRYAWLRMLSCVFVFLFSPWCSPVVLSTEQPTPWTSLDFSSPRATVDSCFGMLDVLKQRKSSPEAAHQDIYQFLLANQELLRRFRFCADFSEIPRERVDEIAIESILYVIEILDRVPPDITENVPDYEQVTADGLNSWRIPGSKIALVRKKSGDREDEWLISAHTIKNLQHYYQQVKNLPYIVDDKLIFGKIGPLGGVHDYYIMEPSGPMLWAMAADNLPSWTLRLHAGQPLWKLLLMLAVCLLAAALWWLVYQVFYTGPSDAHPINSRRLLPPLVGILVCVTVEWFLDEHVGIVGMLAHGTEVFLLTLAWCFLGWLIVAMGNNLSARIQSTQVEKGSDGGLATLLVRSMFFVVAVWLVLWGIEDLGISLIPLLAGLGVGGIAIALAIRPTLENLIAGLIIFADRPVVVGERCRYGGTIGDVEMIGLRSTRIRSIDGTPLSIPNSVFSTFEVENISRRERTLFAPVLGLRYETSGEQLESLMAAFSKMLAEHAHVLGEELRVRFTGFGDYALEVEIHAYIDTGDRERFLLIQQDLNLRIMALVKEAGTDFAFPSQTTYLHRDPGASSGL